MHNLTLVLVELLLGLYLLSDITVNQLVLPHSSLFLFILTYCWLCVLSNSY